MSQIPGFREHNQSLIRTNIFNLRRTFIVNYPGTSSKHMSVPFSVAAGRTLQVPSQVSPRPQAAELDPGWLESAVGQVSPLL